MRGQKYADNDVPSSVPAAEELKAALFPMTCRPITTSQSVTQLFSLPGVFLFLGSVLCAVASGSPEPHAFPPSRYDIMIASSPFALATRAAEPGPDAPNPFADLVVATLAQINDPVTGTHDIVSVRSRADQSAFFTLEGNKPNRDGFEIARIEWSDRVGETKVVIKKGAQIGTLEFDKSGIVAPPARQKAPLPVRRGR